jgi:hypothetical protein
LTDLFDRFREQQTVQGGKVTAADKKALRDKLDSLSLELDKYLARDTASTRTRKRRLTPGGRVTSPSIGLPSSTA